MSTHNQRGFTLIEIMVAVSIISFLSSIASYAFGTARANAQDAVTIATAVATQDAIHQYKDDTSDYPGVANTIVSENQNGGADWNSVMQPLVTAGLLNRIPRSGNPNKPMWIAKFQNPDGQQLVVLGFSYKDNSGGTTINNQCDPFTNPGGRSNGNGDTGGNGPVSQKQAENNSQLAGVGASQIGTGSAGAGEEAGTAAGGEQAITPDGGGSPTNCPAGQVLFGGLCVNITSPNQGGSNNASGSGNAGQATNADNPVDEGGTTPPTDPCSGIGTCVCIK